MEVNTIELQERALELTGETGAENEVVLPDYYPEIQRILHSDASVTVRSRTARGEKYTAEGAVEFRILYLGENGQVAAVRQQVPFGYTFDGRGTDLSESWLHATSDFVSVRALSPNKLHMKATVKLTLTVRRKTDVALIAADDADKEYLEHTVSVCRMLDTVEKPLRLSDEIDVGSLPGIRDILQYDITFAQSEYKLLSSKVIVKAEMLMRVAYTDETGRIVSLEQRVPVSQIADTRELTDDTVCHFTFDVTESRLTARENADGDAKLIAYDLEVTVTTRLYRNEERTVVSDAFSTRCETECTVTEGMLESVQPVHGSFTEKLRMETDRVEEVSAVTAEPQILNYAFDPEKKMLILSGTWRCTALCRDTDHDVICVEKTTPFSVEFPLSDGVRAVRCDCRTAVTGLRFTSDGNGIEAQVDYVCDGVLFLSTSCPILREIKDGAPRESHHAGLILYYAEKGENLWDIAKKYTCSRAVICRTNGLECDALDENKMLIIV